MEEGKKGGGIQTLSVPPVVERQRERQRDKGYFPCPSWARVIYFSTMRHSSARQFVFSTRPRGVVQLFIRSSNYLIFFTSRHIVLCLQNLFFYTFFHASSPFRVTGMGERGGECFGWRCRAPRGTHHILNVGISRHRFTASPDTDYICSNSLHRIAGIFFVFASLMW